MAFENTAPEPKKFFLNLLIKLDFEVASSLYRYNNNTDAINGISQILSLICADNINDATIKKINAEMKQYQAQGSAPVSRLPPIFNDLQKFLNKTWFSELQLGLIPTSALPADGKQVPVKKAVGDHSSRI